MTSTIDLEEREDNFSIENWLHSVPALKTKKLRMDELEALNVFPAITPIEADSKNVLQSSPAAKLNSLDADVNLSMERLTIDKFKSGLPEKELFESMDDDDWSLHRSFPDSTLTLIRESKSASFESYYAPEDELLRLNTMLPPDAGVRFYDYMNPHLQLPKNLFPRKLTFDDDEDEIPATANSFGGGDVMSQDATHRYCPDLECDECEEHLLMMRPENVTFPKEYCSFLLDYRAVRDEDTTDASFQCQFCQGTRWIPMLFHLYHLRTLHGIIDNGEEITLVSHPKLLFEQLTSKGFYTTCLCSTCNKWQKLSSELQTTHGGLFEAWFNHLNECKLYSDEDLGYNNKLN